MITHLKNALFRRSIVFKSYFCFNDSVRQHIERNKAILASSIIHTIMESPLNEYRSKLPCRSLRQTILDKIESYKIDVVNETAQQEIAQKTREGLRKYFVNGVWVPYDMCSQNSFDEASRSYELIKNLEEEVEVEANLDDLSPEEISQLKFCKLQFCPTFLVTGQIFRNIYSSSRFLLLKGQYGVGKTYSLILYTLLSEIIFRYRHKYCSNTKMMDLPKEIDSQIPKALYWSVDLSSEHYSQAFISRLIKRQFYEMKKKSFYVDGHILKPAEVVNMPTLLQSNQPIRTVLLMDQINELAEVLRDYELALKNLKDFISKEKVFQKKKKESQVWQVEIELNKYRGQNLITAMDEASEKHKNYLAYKKILQYIIGKQLFDRIIYLSSVDIQQNYLDQLQLMGWSKQGRIEDNSDRISYPSTLYGDILISDSVELCVFFLKNKWVNQLKRGLNKDEQMLLNKIKEQFHTEIRNKPFTFFLPQRMKPTINKSYTIMPEDFLQEQRKGKLYAKVQLLMQDIQEKSILDMRRELKFFFDNKLPNQQLEKIKPIILLQFWAASVLIEQNTQLKKIEDTKYQKDKTNQILYYLPSCQIELKLVKITDDIRSAMPLKLFGFQGKKLVSYVSPIALRKIIHDQKNNLFYALLTSREAFFKYIKKGALRIFIKSLIIDMLSKGNTNMQFNIIERDDRNRPQRKTRKIQNINKNKSGFIPIPQKTQNSQKGFQFIKSFSSYIEQNLEIPYNKKAFEWNLLLPVKKQFVKNIPQMNQEGIKDYQISHFGNLIDFAMCKLTEFDGSYFLQVNAFGVAGGQTQHEEKLRRFLEQLSHFEDKYNKTIIIDKKKVKVYLNYIVITTMDYQFNCKAYLNNINLNQLKNKKESDSQSQQKNILQQFEFEDCCNLSKLSRPQPNTTTQIKSNSQLNLNSQALVNPPVKECILNYIGVIPIFNNVKVENLIHDLSLDIRMIKRFEEQVQNNPSLIYGQEE